MAVTILLGKIVSLLIKLYTDFSIDMVSPVHRKYQVRAGVSMDINKPFECVTITDSKVSDEELVLRRQRAPINWEQHGLKNFILASIGANDQHIAPDQHVANCILPP